MDRKTELLQLECPISVVQNVVAGKWKILIIWRLKEGAKRFNQLQRCLPNIRQSSLTLQLRELEKDGLIHREIYKEIPPRVEYSLTDIGFKFLKCLDRFGEWGFEYMELLRNQVSK